MDGLESEADARKRKAAARVAFMVELLRIFAGDGRTLGIRHQDGASCPGTLECYTYCESKASVELFMCLGTDMKIDRYRYRCIWQPNRDNGSCNLCRGLSYRTFCQHWSLRERRKKHMGVHRTILVSENAGKCWWLRKRRYHGWCNIWGQLDTHYDTTVAGTTAANKEGTNLNFASETVGNSLRLSQAEYNHPDRHSSVRLL